MFRMAENWVQRKRRKFYDEKLEHYKLPQYKNEDDRKFRIAFLDMQGKLFPVCALAVSILVFSVSYNEKNYINYPIFIVITLFLIMVILVSMEITAKNELEKAVLLRVEEEEKNKNK